MVIMVPEAKKYMTPRQFSIFIRLFPNGMDISEDAILLALDNGINVERILESLPPSKRRDALLYAISEDSGDYEYRKYRHILPAKLKRRMARHLAPYSALRLKEMNESVERIKEPYKGALAEKSDKAKSLHRELEQVQLEIYGINREIEQRVRELQSRHSVSKEEQGIIDRYKKLAKEARIRESIISAGDARHIPKALMDYRRKEGMRIHIRKALRSTPDWERGSDRGKKHSQDE